MPTEILNYSTLEAQLSSCLTLQSLLQVLMQNAVYAYTNNAETTYSYFKAAIVALNKNWDVSSVQEKDLQVFFNVLASANLDIGSKITFLLQLISALQPSKVIIANTILSWLKHLNSKRSQNAVSRLEELVFVRLIKSYLIAMLDSASIQAVEVFKWEIYGLSAITYTNHSVADPLVNKALTLKDQVDVILLASQHHEIRFTKNLFLSALYKTIAEIYPHTQAMINSKTTKMQNVILPNSLYFLPEDLLGNTERMFSNIELKSICAWINLMESKHFALLVAYLLNTRSCKDRDPANLFQRLPFDILLHILDLFNVDKPHGSIKPMVRFFSENYSLFTEKVRKRETLIMVQKTSNSKTTFRFFDSVKLAPVNPLPAAARAELIPDIICSN